VDDLLVAFKPPNNVFHATSKFMECIHADTINAKLAQVYPEIQ
jgi:hypothetical protein